MLPDPAIYTPYLSGKYSVAPGLQPLGTDFGAGRLDECTFQVDRLWPEFHANKLEARRQELARYVRESTETTRDRDLLRSAVRQMVEKLAEEHPEHFQLHAWEHGPAELVCRLSGDRLVFDAYWDLVDHEAEHHPDPPFQSAWDAVCSQVQADAVLISRDESGADRVAALHVCAPSAWAPVEKFGQSFLEVHRPVPGMEPTLVRSDRMVDLMISRGPWVRFVWGISALPRLNRHTDPPVGVSEAEWNPPRFDADRSPPFCVHVERQVTWPVGAASAALFLIHVGFQSADTIRASSTHRDALAAAIRSMTPESLAYKGLAAHSQALLDWLEQPSTGGF